MPVTAMKGLFTLKGDTNPEDFDFQHVFTNEELLVMYKRNPNMQKLCDFFAGRALEDGIQLDVNQSIEGEKFGRPFTFPNFVDWVKWIGAWEEIRHAIAYTRLFSQAIIVFFSPNDKAKKITGKMGQTFDYFGALNSPATKCKTFYPLTNSNGYVVSKKSEDNFREPMEYEIHYFDREPDTEGNLKEELIYRVSADRVVMFAAPQKELGYYGTSKAIPIAHISLIQEQMLKSVFKSMHKFAAAFIVARAHSEVEATKINDFIKNGFSYITRLFYSGSQPLDDVLKLEVPDLKIDQLFAINMIIQKYLANAMNISIRELGEEDIAAGIGNGGAKFSSELVQAEIRDIQDHYKRPIQKAFYLLGLENTEFEWLRPWDNQNQDFLLSAESNLNNIGMNNNGFGQGGSP